MNNEELKALAKVLRSCPSEKDIQTIEEIMKQDEVLRQYLTERQAATIATKDEELTKTLKMSIKHESMKR